MAKGNGGLIHHYVGSYKEISLSSHSMLRRKQVHDLNITVTRGSRGVSQNNLRIKWGKEIYAQ